MNAPDSHEGRLLRYLKALVSNYTAFLINVGTFAVTVPLLLQWLGSEQYGIWLIFMQLTSVAIFGTMWTAVPIAREATSCYIDRAEWKTRQLFQTALAYCTLCGIGVIVLTLLFSQVFPQFFQLLSGLQADTAGALVLLSLYAAGSMQLNLLFSMLTGFEQMHIANFLLGTSASLGTSLGIISDTPRFRTKWSRSGTCCWRCDLVQYWLAGGATDRSCHPRI